MKMLLFFIFYLVVVITNGQEVCLSANTFIGKKKILDSVYVPIDEYQGRTFTIRQNTNDAYVVSFSEMTQQMRRISKVRGNIISEVKQVITDNPLLKKKIDKVAVNVYLNDKGNVDHTYFDFPDNLLSNWQLDNLLTSLCSAVTQSVYNTQINKPVRIEVRWRVSQELSYAKKVKSKGTVYSLDDLNETNRKDTVTAVSIGGEDIKKIPKILKNFKNIVRLDLRDNEIEKVPSFIFKMPHLLHLNLIGNRIEYDKMFFKKRSNLVSIDLQYNKISKFPKRIARLKSLASLWLGHNDLSHAFGKKSIGNMGNLLDLNLYDCNLIEWPTGIEKIQNLRILDLYYNNIVNIPSSISLNRKLEKLGLSHNKIDSISIEHICLLNLKELYLAENKIRNVPIDINRLVNLRYIDLSNNLIDKVNGSLFQLLFLKEINLSHNKINSMPFIFNELIFLKKINISDNKISRSSVAGKIFLDNALSKKIEVNF